MVGYRACRPLWPINLLSVTSGSGRARGRQVRAAAERASRNGFPDTTGAIQSVHIQSLIYNLCARTAGKHHTRRPDGVIAMITIDNRSCNGCGRCASICHQSCIAIQDRQATIDYALCSTCCQCVAVCPTQVFSWDGVSPAPFDDTRLPVPEQMEELFQQRRTIREFKDQKLDRALLETIVNFGVYAPTHNFELRAIIVDEDELIQVIDTAVLNFSRTLYNWVYKNPIMRWLARWSGQVMRKEFTRAKSKLQLSIERGRAYKSRPVAVILIVGDMKVPLSLESAQYALYTMNLYAMTKNVGCRNLVGNQMILNRNKGLRRRLGILRHEEIFAVMGVGFPAIRFRNKVSGKRMRLSWNGSPY